MPHPDAASMVCSLYHLPSWKYYGCRMKLRHDGYRQPCLKQVEAVYKRLYILELSCCFIKNGHGLAHRRNMQNGRRVLHIALYWRPVTACGVHSTGFWLKHRRFSASCVMACVSVSCRYMAFARRLLRMQKTAFCIAKGRLSWCRRPSFAVAKGVFAIAYCPCFAMQTWQNKGLTMLLCGVMRGKAGCMKPVPQFLFVMTFYSCNCIFMHKFSSPRY